LAVGGIQLIALQFGTPSSVILGESTVSKVSAVLHNAGVA